MGLKLFQDRILQPILVHLKKRKKNTFSQMGHTEKYLKNKTTPPKFEVCTLIHDLLLNRMWLFPNFFSLKNDLCLQKSCSKFVSSILASKIVFLDIWPQWSISRGSTTLKEQQQTNKQTKNGYSSFKLRCDDRFTHAFTACGCVFKEITLVGSNQGNYFENATACSKRKLKTTVATQL